MLLSALTYTHRVDCLPPTKVVTESDGFSVASDVNGLE